MSILPKFLGLKLTKISFSSSLASLNLLGFVWKWLKFGLLMNTSQLTSSGDRNPKNLVLQNDCIWFSHTVNVNGKAAVQWHQVKLDGAIVQTGLISNEKTNYIQTTIAVNKNNDVLVGFQDHILQHAINQ